MVKRIWHSDNPQIQALLSSGATIFRSDDGGFVVLSIADHKGEPCGFIQSSIPTQELIRAALSWKDGGRLPKLLAVAHGSQDREALSQLGFTTHIEAIILSIWERTAKEESDVIPLRPSSQSPVEEAPEKSPTQRGRKAPRRTGSGGNPPQPSSEEAHHPDSSPGGGERKAG